MKRSTSIIALSAGISRGKPPSELNMLDGKQHMLFNGPNGLFMFVLN
jgi:hypothetical protein